jgi:hypothetical protein
MYCWVVASRKVTLNGVAQIIDATQSQFESELGVENGFHGRALNAGGPTTHYRDVCAVDVVGPDFPCDPTDLARLIEGSPSKTASSTTTRSGQARSSISI